MRGIEIKFFFSYVKLYYRVFRDIILRWIRFVMVVVGVDVIIFKFYSIRVVVVSKVKNVFVLVKEILDIVGWFLERICDRFYNKFF